MDKIEQIEHTLHDLGHIKRSDTFWGFVAALLLATGLLWLKHGEWLDKPNDVILGESSDGYKNYMTATWHTIHDTTFTHYGGMNYPYGDHVLFTDCQPILSTAMQWWNHNISDISQETVGYLNVIMMYGFVFCAGFLFLLFRKLHLPVWYAILAALPMTFMSPQFERIDGHYGLAHAWFVPLLLLLLCRYEEQKSRRYHSLHIGILVWFGAQLHFYNFGLSALFLSLYTGVQVLSNFTRDNIMRRFSHWVVMVVLPFFLLNLWLRWSDFCADRPAYPWGFLHYIGHWEGVFLPYEGLPLFDWIDKNIIHIRRIGSESHAYVGAAATLYTIYLLFSRFKLFDKTWDEAAYHRVHKQYLRGIFSAAFILLVFSCGFPFAIKGMDWMVEYMGPFRQFRGLGRFTWAWYHVVNICLFYAAWNYSKRFKGFKDGKYPWFSWVIALTPVAILAYEAYLYQGQKRLDLKPNNCRREIFVDSPEHWMNKVDFSPYQALMPLPYYHVGSENLWMDIDPGSFHFKRMQASALHSGVPDMGVNMSRQSIGHMLKSVQFALPPCVMPELLDEMPNEKPIALMVKNEQWEEIKIRYKHLVSKAKEVYNNPDMRILSLSLDSVKTYRTEMMAELEADMNRVAIHDAGNGWKSDQAPLFYRHLGFDSISSKNVFQGKGAVSGIMSDTTMLYRDNIPVGSYYLSMWIYVKDDGAMTHEVKIVENAKATGQEIRLAHEGLRYYLKAIVNGWALFDIPFLVTQEGTVTSIFLQKKTVNLPFTVDEVQIKHTNMTLFRREPDWLVRNNYWYKR